jgi:alpha-D-ribose 1-methylphosphonate 5-triphosphate diphosphatase
VLDLAASWRLVSTNAARAAGLADRGAIAAGQRADLLLVDAEAGAPALRAVFAQGRMVWADSAMAGRVG